jgi:hypothetical protein
MHLRFFHLLHRAGKYPDAGVRPVQDADGLPEVAMVAHDAENRHMKLHNVFPV